MNPKAEVKRLIGRVASIAYAHRQVAERERAHVEWERAAVDLVVAAHLALPTRWMASWRL